MTEAMSRREIEDVLSSIRRLVAHDGRAGHAATPATEQGTTGRAPSKLLLTSALRVDDAGAADNAPTAPPQDGTPQADDRAAPQDGDDPRAAFLDCITRADVPPPGDPVPAGQDTQDDTAPDTGKPVDAAAPDTAITDSALEATLSRLERALAVPPPESGPAPQPDDPAQQHDALRQLVTQIVREELQGELGEKITRNIRKLVRAEVARELAGRAL